MRSFSYPFSRSYFRDPSWAPCDVRLTLRPYLGVVELITEAVAALLILGSLGLVGCLVADELGLGLVQMWRSALVADVVVRRLLLGRQVVLATAGLEVVGLEGVAEHRLVLDVLRVVVRGGDGGPDKILGGVRKHDWANGLG